MIYTIGRGHRTGGSSYKIRRLFRPSVNIDGGRAAGDLCLLLTKSINKVFTKIKAKFTESEQQLFVASFYGFLKYDPNNDFVIDKHYKKSLYQPGKQSDHTRGGQKLCLKAWTKRQIQFNTAKLSQKVSLSTVLLTINCSHYLIQHFALYPSHSFIQFLINHFTFLTIYRVRIID